MGRIIPEKGDEMKKSFYALFILAFLLSACQMPSLSTPTPIVIVVTSTPEPVTATPQPTNTTQPSSTPSPTNTYTPAPTEIPITMLDIETAFRKDGYTRAPYKSSFDSDLRGFAWTKDNPYEQVLTWDNGSFRLEVINDESDRSLFIERKFKVLDTVFSPEFMAKLRKENWTYSEMVTSSVSGQPAQMYMPTGPSDQFWKSKIGQYNTYETKVGTHDVLFSLWWWQVTCPPQYWFCFVIDFPNAIFQGDASFVYYTVEIKLTP